MFSWALLILELIILFLTSRYIFQAIYLLSFKAFKNEHSATIPLFLLFSPGVIIHELAHLLIAEILFVKSYQIEIWPKIEHGRVHMGSIQIQETDIIRRVIIGVSPIIVGILFLAAILLMFENYIGVKNSLSSYLNLFIGAIVVWAVFVVTNTMFSSKKDTEGLLELLLAFLFLMLVIVIASMFLKFDISTYVQNLFFNQRIAKIIGNLTLLLSFPLALNLAAFLAAKAFIKNNRAF